MNHSPHLLASQSLVDQGLLAFSVDDPWISALRFRFVYRITFYDLALRGLEIGLGGRAALYWKVALEVMRISGHFRLDFEVKIPVRVDSYWLWYSYQYANVTHAPFEYRNFTSNLFEKLGLSSLSIRPTVAMISHLQFLLSGCFQMLQFGSFHSIGPVAVPRLQSSPTASRYWLFLDLLVKSSSSHFHHLSWEAAHLKIAPKVLGALFEFINANFPTISSVIKF